jgi:PAS domain S-box-containing protein
MDRILRESSIEIYHSIIEHNPDAIFVLSIHGEIMEVNQVVTKIFGYSEEKKFKESKNSCLTLQRWEEELI